MVYHLLVSITGYCTPSDVFKFSGALKSSSLLTVEQIR